MGGGEGGGGRECKDKEEAEDKGVTGNMFAIAGKMRMPTYRDAKYEPLELLCDSPQEVGHSSKLNCENMFKE